MSLLSHFRSTPPTRAEYFAIFLEALTNRGVIPTMLDEVAFILRLPAGNTVYLDNGFSAYSKARPAERKGILEHYIAAAFTLHETEATYSEAKKALLPVLRADTYASMIALSIHASESNKQERMASIPFAPGLIMAIVRDTPDTMMFVNESTLVEWQVSAEQALEVALENLRAFTAGPKLREHSPGLFQATWKDGYSTSRVALPELFQQLEIDGDPVFFAPTRDLLWVTGHRDVFNQAYMFKLGEESHFDAYPLSPNLYRLKGDRWELYTPEDLTVATALHTLQQRRANLDYQQQQPLLAAVLERDNVEVFVASHNLYEDPDGKLFSMCIWTKGVDSLLPVTDQVILFVNGEPGERIILP